jgi:hypothetical protein
MKPTKENLVKENAVLTEKIKLLETLDQKRRTTLSELLDSYSINRDEWTNRTKKEVDVKDWMGIAFLIGELKADANYAMCIEAREELKREIGMLKQHIYKLEHPDLIPLNQE